MVFWVFCGRVCSLARTTATQDGCGGRVSAAAAATLLVVFQYDLITLYLWTRHGRNQGFLPNPVCLIERMDDENKQELQEKNKKYQSEMAFYFVVAGEEMWKFNCWRVSLQLSNFIYFYFFFRLVSQGRPLGNISIDIIFFFVFLETCL